MINTSALEDWLKSRDLLNQEESLVETLRSLLLEGKITKGHLLRVRGFGPKTWSELLDLLGLEECVRKRQPSVAIPILSSQEMENVVGLAELISESVSD